MKKAASGLLTRIKDDILNVKDEVEDHFNSGIDSAKNFVSSVEDVGHEVVDFSKLIFYGIVMIILYLFVEGIIHRKEVASYAKAGAQKGVELGKAAAPYAPLLLI